MSYDYLFKFIVIGDSGSGKTCSVLQFTDKRFEPMHDLTIGVEFASTIVETQQQPAQKIKVQIWDTAGQESFQSITRSYYRGSAGVVLMYDITRWHTFERAKRWLSDVHNSCHRNVSIILVGNKHDLEHRREVSLEEGQAFAKQNGLLFCETSAKTGYQIPMVFKTLVNDVYQKVLDGIVTPDDDSGIRLGLKPNSYLDLENSSPSGLCCCY